MSDAPTMNPHKVKALELAVQAGGESAAIVARATAFHLFLTGNAASPPPAAGAKTATPPTGAAGGGKPADKPAAPKAAAGAKAPDKPAAPKPAAPAAGAPKATAAKPGAGAAASASAVPGDTKAPGGKNTYDDVVKALCDVRAKQGKENAIAILKEDGGVGSVRDLKPALYDAVVEGCRNALEGEGEGGAAADTTTEDLTAGPQLDEFGMPVE
jgi:hypothetical protein